jgi:hypothetical protein
MKLPWRLTDRKLIEQTERFESRIRRPLAVFMLLLVAAYSCAAGWFGHLILWKNPVTVLLDDTEKQAYEIGLMVGSVLAMKSFAILFGLVFALVLLFGGRKNRLLIRCFRDLEETRTGPAHRPNDPSP